MTCVYITIDTEYSALLARQGASQRQNYARSIACETPGGSVGIQYQMDVFDRHGLTGIFFVDPMPAMLWGAEAVTEIVQPIIARGHEVQLHVHTEWLEFAGRTNPLGLPTGRNIADFSQAQQVSILEYARSVLIKAGAPAPVAFRAGNYGANDDTLRALSEVGMQYDTSHCPGIKNSECAIELGPQNRQVIHHAGAIEIPIGAIGTPGEGLRHAQITALTAREILSAVRHARDNHASCFTLVSHSFELLSRDRMQVNRVVKRRFEALCAGLGQMEGVAVAGYHDRPPDPAASGAEAHVLPFGRMRTCERMAEQAVSNLLYGRG